MEKVIFKVNKNVGICPKHNKPYIYSHVSKSYCKKCLDSLFEKLDKYNMNFDTEVKPNESES